MSKAITTHPFPVACGPAVVRASGRAGAPASPGWGKILRWFATARRRRLAICELHRLGDERLCDIGLARGEIASVVDALMAGERDAGAALQSPVSRYAVSRSSPSAPPRSSGRPGWRSAWPDRR